MKKGKCIHRFSNATKVINKGHLEFFQPTKCPLRPNIAFFSECLTMSSSSEQLNNSTDERQHNINLVCIIPIEIS